MNEKTYKTMVERFSKSKRMIEFLKFSNKTLPLVFYISYPLLLILKALEEFDREFIRILIVPLCVFLGVTVMRKIILRPRPYEKFHISPVIPNERKGQSFPSRHTASAVIIALSAFLVNVPFAIVLCAVALVVTTGRVLAGIHYISDVLFATLLSASFGVLFFFII